MAKNDAEGFSKELLDQLLAGRDPKTVLDSGGLIGDLKKALAERMLNAEIVDEHCYAMPDWFLRAATRYDGYNRKGPKVFMGEYAAQ